MEEKELEPIAEGESADAQPAEPASAPAEEPSDEGGETTDYAKLAEEDMRALQEEFPELAGKTTVAELESPLRYAQLRDLGLSPKEAYLAVGGGSRPAERPYDNRSHLRTSVPHSASRTEDGLSAAEMASARDLFSGVSDAEIRRLYRRVTAGK